MEERTLLFYLIYLKVVILFRYSFAVLIQVLLWGYGYHVLFYLALLMNILELHAQSKKVREMQKLLEENLDD